MSRSRVLTTTINITVKRRKMDFNAVKVACGLLSFVAAACKLNGRIFCFPHYLFSLLVWKYPELCFQLLVQKQSQSSSFSYIIKVQMS